jgi:hypothetical protein
MEDELDFTRIEAAIGRLILACSRVEYELFRLYQKWIPKHDYFAEKYAKRYNRAIEIARNKLNSADDVVEMLVRMKELTRVRHIVAHNPVHYINAGERDELGLHAEFAIVDQKGGQRALSISDMERYAREAYRLSVKLAGALRTRA